MTIRNYENAFQIPEPEGSGVLIAGVESRTHQALTYMVTNQKTYWKFSGVEHLKQNQPFIYYYYTWSGIMAYLISIELINIEVLSY